MRFKSIWQMSLLLGVASTSTLYANAVASTPASTAVATTAAATTTPAGPVDTATLMKQLDDLKKQVSQIAHKQRKADEKLESTTQVEDAKIGILQANQISPYPEGYISVPGTNSAIKIGGRIKADATYYAGKPGDVSGGELIARNVGINKVNSTNGDGHFNGTVQGSRFEMNSLTRTSSGDVKARFQSDFYGANGSGGAGADSSSTNYGLRVRQAYVEWANILVGQIESNFFDADLAPDTLDNQGQIVTPPRRVQLRYMQKVCDGLSLTVAVEKGETDYMSQAAVGQDNANNGKTSVPDFTARLTYEGKQGLVSLRGIMRTLQVNVAKGDAISTATGTATSAVDFKSKQTAWGLGVSGKYITTGLSNLYAQVNVGDGLGYLIDDASNQAAYLQVPTQTNHTTQARFDTNMVTNGAAGYEHWWTEAFRTNVSGSYTKIKNSPFSPVSSGVNQINSRIKKMVVNAIYSPAKSIDIGVELMLVKRQTIGGVTADGTIYRGGTGKAAQLMTSFIYKF